MSRGGADRDRITPLMTHNKKPSDLVNSCLASQPQGRERVQDELNSTAEVQQPTIQSRFES